MARLVIVGPRFEPVMVARSRGVFERKCRVGLSTR